jgi:hypothetical protein
MRIAAAALLGKSIPNSPMSIVSAALKPTAKKVRANAKRLSKRR